MRSSLLLCATLLLVSCVRVRTAGFDRQAGKVTTCGNRHASDFDLRAEAARSCANPEVLRCGEEVRGTYATAVGTTSAVAVPIRGTCCVYACR
jgi:hypothetical protein